VPSFLLFFFAGGRGGATVLGFELGFELARWGLHHLSPTPSLEPFLDLLMGEENWLPGL
jgi:hypothetical protein